MPTNEEHCKDSLKRTGKTFKELHRWMDKYWEWAGRAHRNFRHSMSNSEDVTFVFNKWGMEGIEEMRNHIKMDSASRFLT